MVVIVDYGMGNLRSVSYRLHQIKVEAMVSSDPEDLKKADKIILPGVGAFETGMQNLKSSGFIPLLNERVLGDKVPVLGICLGMQLFTNHSEEGNAEGLGWVDAETKRFDFSNNEIKHKVPHMGWNSVDIRKNNSKMMNDLPENPSFYFVHSYHVQCNDEEVILASTVYGYEFTSILQKDNIYGVQFHPEKSHKGGVQLLKNFAAN